MTADIKTDTKTVHDIQDFLDQQDRETSVVVIDKDNESVAYPIVGLYTGNGQVRIIIDLGLSSTDVPEEEEEGDDDDGV